MEKELYPRATEEDSEADSVADSLDTSFLKQALGVPKTHNETWKYVFC